LYCFTEIANVSDPSATMAQCGDPNPTENNYIGGEP